MDDTFRIICALCIIFLQFPLYYLAPTEPILYTDVITNDASLCDYPIKQLLHKSEFTKNCMNLTYPSNIDKLTLKDESMQTFLCLGMHDTIYKVCQYTKNNTWTNTFNKKEDLDSSIEKLSKFKTQDEFCKNLSGFSPMYKKTQPALSKLVELLKDSKKCNKICFDVWDKLYPSCALLAWINQIDETVKKNITAEHNKLKDGTSKSSDIPNNHESSIEKGNVNHDEQSANRANPASSTNVRQGDIGKQSDQKLAVDDNRTSVSNSVNNVAQRVQKEKVKEVEQTDNQVNDIAKPKSVSDTSAPQTGISNPKKLPDKLQLPSHVGNDNVNSDVTNAKNLPHNIDQNDNTVKTGQKIIDAISTSSLIEDIKSTTLSENTQDNIDEDNVANNPNPDDFSHIDDDQLRSGLIDSLGQPIDTDNRNENIPVTSGQSEMENFHVNKNDEESHFFTYFAIISLSFIAGYIGYHNKQKILAIVLEGRRSKNNRGRRRPSTANYRKLDCTLEEAVTSQCNANVTHVIY